MADGGSRKFRYSNFPIVTANIVELMADYVITASGISNVLRPRSLSEKQCSKR